MINLHCFLILGGATADDFWAEDVPAGIAPVDMDTGNPWDSAAPATTEATVDPFVAAEKESIVVQSGPESAWAEFADSEMVPVTPEVVKPEVDDVETVVVTSSEPEASTDAQVPVIEIAASDESSA